jgi:hypothetical protein
MLFSESLQLICGRVISRAKVQVRSVLLAREFHRLLAAAGQSRFNREQNGSVAIKHIPFGPLNVCSRSRFFQRILRINRPVLGLRTLRAPSPGFHTVRQRPIRSSPVRRGIHYPGRDAVRGTLSAD